MIRTQRHEGNAAAELMRKMLEIAAQHFIKGGSSLIKFENTPETQDR